jgi:hypothetical protein
MRKILWLLLSLSVGIPLWAVDTTGMTVAGESERFTLYAQDDRDYGELLATLEDAYLRVASQLNPGFHKKVTAYIYRDQLSFVKAVFGWTMVEMNVTGLADHVRSILYLTSSYDSCRPAEHMKRMPVHELTHLIYHSNVVWIREGVANYEAGIFRGFDVDDLPTCVSDLRFSGSDDQREAAYNYSAWMVRYIVERLLANDATKLPKYLSEHTSSNGRITPNEAAFFSAWRAYMRENKAQPDNGS